MIGPASEARAAGVGQPEHMLEQQQADQEAGLDPGAAL
jgi:hypothetical protein